jgi:hypothetical protein
MASGALLITTGWTAARPRTGENHQPDDGRMANYSRSDRTLTAFGALVDVLAGQAC